MVWDIKKVGQKLAIRLIQNHILIRSWVEGERSLQYLRDHPFCSQTHWVFLFSLFLPALCNDHWEPGDWTASVCSVGKDNVMSSFPLYYTGHILIKIQIQIQIQRWCHIVTSYVAHTEIRIENAVLPISQFHDFWATGLTSSRCIITRPANFAAA